MAPSAIALSLTPSRIAEKPALAIGGAIIGAMAGLAQAVGLWRWDIENIAREFNGKVDVNFANAGLQCAIEAPLDRVLASS